MDKKPRVFVGVSGGVDSSVSLALLKKEGYDVTGVFLKVWNPDFLPCNWREERRSAMRVCATLGVPFLTIDCVDEYKREVVDYMINEYSVGRVPNPDIFCNKYVKFGVFLKKAKELGADYIATGHYAQRTENREEGVGKSGYELREGHDINKDQSYFLYTLNQDQLKCTLFPIGHLTKPEVRELAKKFDLPTAEKKDSQGLCFIGKVDMKDFLEHFIEPKVGDVLNTGGEVIGSHNGAIFLTIGQRHGFNITKKGPNDERYFIIAKDINKNTVTVADKNTIMKESHSTKKILIKDLHLIGDNDFLSRKLFVRIRYRQEKQECLVEKTNIGYYINFEKDQEGVSVGQSAVLYEGDVCMGGGIIEEVL